MPLVALMMAPTVAPAGCGSSASELLGGDAGATPLVDASRASLRDAGAPDGAPHDAAAASSEEVSGDASVDAEVEAEAGAANPCGVGPDGFSAQLSVYQNPTAATSSVDDIVDAIDARSSGGASDQSTMRAIVTMYKSAGIDLSLGTDTLRALAPTSWCAATPQPLSGSFLQPYSVDSTFYHPIPAGAPRVELPAGTLRSFNVQTVSVPASVGPAVSGPAWQQGLGIAISGGASRPGDPQVTLRGSGTFGACGEGQDVQAVVRPDAVDFFPQNDDDCDMNFIDATHLTVTSVWHVMAPPPPGIDGGPALPSGVSYCGVAVTQSPLGDLGTDPAVVAAGFSNIVTLLRQGEASDPLHPIPHALAGPTTASHLLPAMVYPASLMDGWQSTQPSHGLLPYGAHLQLDPTLDIASLGLPLPAFRILEALQTYGWYVNDAGDDDLDVYSNTTLDDFGSDAGQAASVFATIAAVIGTHAMYLVPPVVRTR